MSFEKEYYEHAGFWDGDMLVDEQNTKRFQKTISMIPDSVKSLVDLGCGNGIFVNSLKEINKIPNIVGIDRSQQALNYVKTEKILSDIMETNLDDDSFDCVSSLEVIEHLPIPIYKKALEELTRISKKYVIISVPYEEVLEKSYNKCPKCCTIFNLDLHLRTYNTDNFIHMLDEYGYKNIDYCLEGESKEFIGHDLYVSIFYPSQKKLKWKSPICPICGYKNGKTIKKNKVKIQNSKTLFTSLKNIPKQLWPKKTNHYWIIGLFEKSN